MGGRLAGLYEALVSTNTAMGALLTTAQSTAQGVLTSTQQVREDVEQTATQVEQGTTRINEAITQAKSKGIRQLDELKNRVEQFSSTWGTELKEQIGLIEIGGQRLDEFLTKWGDVVVQTEDGTQRIREIVDGADLRGIENEIQTLISALNSGKAQISDVAEFLANKGGQIGQMLRGWISAYEQGTMSLEQLATKIRALQAQFPGGALDNLLDAIENGLVDGRV